MVLSNCNRKHYLASRNSVWDSKAHSLALACCKAVITRFLEVGRGAVGYAVVRMGVSDIEMELME